MSRARDRNSKWGRMIILSRIGMKGAKREGTI